MAQFWFQNVVPEGLPVVGYYICEAFVILFLGYWEEFKSYTNSLNIQLDLFKILQTQHQGFSKDGFNFKY